MSLSGAIAQPADAHPVHDVICTGCHYRADAWSGLFDHRKAGQVEHTFMRDPACPIHGTSPDPRIP